MGVQRDSRRELGGFGLGVGGLGFFPDVGKEIGEFARLEVGEAEEDIAQVLPDVEAVAAGAGDDRVDDRGRHGGCQKTAGFFCPSR